MEDFGKHLGIRWELKGQLKNRFPTHQVIRQGQWTVREAVGNNWKGIIEWLPKNIREYHVAKVFGQGMQIKIGQVLLYLDVDCAFQEKPTSQDYEVGCKQTLHWTLSQEILNKLRQEQRQGADTSQKGEEEKETRIGKFGSILEEDISMQENPDKKQETVTQKEKKGGNNKGD